MSIVMKISRLILPLFLVGILTACGETNTEPEEIIPLTTEEYQKLHTSPDEYTGRGVEFFGKIFVTPESDEDGTYLQVFADNDLDRNTIIWVQDPNLDVEEGDIIRVEGTVMDQFEGENTFGGSITAPLIAATDIEKTDYMTAFAPAIETIEVNEEIEQHDVNLTVEKIEIAEQETRVYVKIENNSSDEFSFYSFNQRAVIENTQLDTEDNWESNYPEIQSNILPGIETSGILLFPKFEGESVRLHLEGRSDDFSLDFEPFNFDINLK